jgi:hypothetical protein
MIKPTPLSRFAVYGLTLAYISTMIYLLFFNDILHTPFESLPFYYWLMLAVIPAVFIFPTLIAGKKGTRKPSEGWSPLAQSEVISFFSLGLALLKVLSNTASNQGGSIALFAFIGFSQVILVLLAIGGWDIRSGILAEEIPKSS